MLYTINLYSICVPFSCWRVWPNRTSIYCILYILLFMCTLQLLASVWPNRTSICYILYLHYICVPFSCWRVWPNRTSIYWVGLAKQKFLSSGFRWVLRASAGGLVGGLECPVTKIAGAILVTGHSRPLTDPPALALRTHRNPLDRNFCFAKPTYYILYMCALQLLASVAK